MPLFKKKPAAKDAAAGGGDSSMFGITLEQLNEIMEVRGKDLMEKLNSSDYNGVKGILEKLKVDGNKGLDSKNEQDLEQRRVAYGRNEIPPKPMKKFIRLCWDAFHEDMLLIILLICSIVSICLSFYKPPHKEGDTQDEGEYKYSIL
jgi:magnesium-transporting ATPase (P-type)